MSRTFGDTSGAILSLQHALDCKKGGLIIQRHNEIRDCIGNMAAQLWIKSSRSQADVSTGDDGLQLDLGIRGAWQPQVEALFDIKVIDTDASSHRNRSPVGVWH